MKRKLFTLLFALVALASFQVSAVGPWWIKVDTTGLTLPAYGADKTVNANWLISKTATVDEINTSSSIFSDKDVNKFDVSVVDGTKQIKIKSTKITGAAQLQLTYGGASFDAFEVVKFATGTNMRQVQTPPTAMTGSLEGYLTVPQSGGGTDLTSNSEEMMIVVVDQNRQLSIKRVKEVFSGSPLAYTAAAKMNLWRPLWIKLEKPAGRWATTADFADCVYWKFNNLPVAKDAVALEKNLRTTPTANVFKVTQVDWLAQTTDKQSKKNIFGNDTESAYAVNPYYKTKFVDNTGLQMNVPSSTGGYSGNDNVIPLFILSSPDNDCKVVSVSRQNELSIQNQPDGLYGSRLELREYGQYFDYHKSGTNYTYGAHSASTSADWDAHRAAANAGSPVLQEDRVATSLQKFAIWITEDGDKTIYPLASYYWQYGVDKRDQPNNVYPNSALIYNDPSIMPVAGGAVADRNWGVKIDVWKADIATNAPKKNDIVVGPNVVVSNVNMTYYEDLFLDVECNSVPTGEFAGKFFFLETNVKADGYTFGNIYDDLYLATRKEAYQDSAKTKYVLSTEVSNGKKHLIVLPKERIRRYNNQDTLIGYDALQKYKRIEGGNTLNDYWTINPYDSVNMAAHWGIYPHSSGKYVLVNMLGDTLQYNVSGTNASEIKGYYLPENNKISDDGIFSPENNNGSAWFDGSANAADNDTKFLWSVSAVPGSDGVVLSLDGYKLELNGAWYQADRHARKGGAQDSIYYQKDVVVSKNNNIDNPNVIYGHNYGPYNCIGGILVNKEPIYYVPNWSQSYMAEDQTPGNTAATINTSDPNFIDRNAKVERDSLTAYLLLDGYYGIQEAARVENNLFLTESLNEDNRSAAVFKAGAGKDVQFIPLVSVVRDRNANIRKAIDGNPVTNCATDTLYGETYKWFLVKLNDKYLVYDTLNLTAPDTKLRLGFVFKKVGIENATPVRLYQPLVGDKLQGNFLFQFYAPVNRYDVATKTVTTYDWSATSLSNGAIAIGDRLFAQLNGNQSDYIIGVKDKVDATRFTYAIKGGDNECFGCDQFIDPAWMASQKLISFPIYNQVWTQKSTDYPTGATGFTIQASPKTTSGNKSAFDEAIIRDGGGAFSKIKHVFVDSIKYDKFVAGQSAYHYSDGISISNNVPGFQKELDVALYYIMDENDRYLTVDTTTYQYDSRVTTSDVTGVNLVWREKLLPFNQDPKLNQRALQLFAITGIQSDRLDNGWYTECGTYVYMPLASYQVNYAQGKVDTTEIHYNYGLGKSAGYEKCNDVTSAWRVTQYSTAYRNQKNLIVANTTGGGQTSIIPVEFKWKKEAYDVIGCDYQLVKNVNTRNRDNFYYAAGGLNYSRLCKADSNTMLAHWKISHDVTDAQLHRFATETFTGYGADITSYNTELKGNYYFKKISESGKTTKVRALNFANYDWTTNYRIAEDTLEITCVEHDLPFLDLENNRWQNFELAISKLISLEALFADRNLTDAVRPNTPNKISNNSYQVYVDQYDSNDPKYIRVIKTKERALTVGTDHVIPYYAFSVSRGNTDYYLSVLPKNGTTRLADSVYWTSISPANLTKLQNGSDDMKLFQFCLPYQVEVEGNDKGKQIEKDFNGKKWPAVYLQTLDVDQEDYPYLIVTGSATKYVTTKNLREAIHLNTGCTTTNGYNSLFWNIYSVDYSQIIPTQVTAWIFPDATPYNEHEWVPLRDTNGVSPITGPQDGKDVDGLLASYQLASGTTNGFVTNSGNSFDYGLLLSTEKTLHFTYEGTEQIGPGTTKPIYYYRINIKDQADKYLTDSYGSTGGNFEFNGDTYKMAHFTAKTTSTVSGKKYDAAYKQSFGLRYFDGTETGEKGDPYTFVVVSNANYQNPVETEYRYLAAVQGRLVFVKGIKNAMLFQFGRNNGNGFTDISVVGQAGVVGVEGGVKVLNQTGKVDIYAIDGSLIKSVDVTSADQTVAAPRGVVIVKIAGKATKVVVK